MIDFALTYRRYHTGPNQEQALRTQRLSGLGSRGVISSDWDTHQGVRAAIMRNIQHCRDRLQKCMAEDPDLKRRVESATDRENRWLAEHIVKTQKTMFDEELSQGPLPHTAAFEHSQPTVVAQGASNKEEAD